MGRYVIAEVAEIPVGGRKMVEVAGRSIGVFNVAGEFYALRNSCPHQGGPLCTGTISGFVSSTGPGDYQLTRQGEMLRCPWHGWEFDIRTGQSWFDPRKVRVRRYEVHVESGESVATVEPETAGEMEKGPYMAETYPVTVERQYVVIEVPG
jgi:3-phenylpropionate/trans-cinnamate dioxygenase ferredoxin subunit